MNSTTSACVAVLGAGAWGTALAIVLAQNGHRVYLWGRDADLIKTLQDTGSNESYLPGAQFPKTLTPCSDLEFAIKDATEILIAVPSSAFRSVVTKTRSLLTQNTPLFFATKGLDATTGSFLDEMIKTEHGASCPVAVLSGPSFAREVGLGHPTAVTIASDQFDFAKHLSSLFHTPTFRPYISTDIKGVQICGTLKNVMAIAAGISDGLNFGANTRAAVITRGLSEMITLGKAIGASSETLYGLAGLGDLVLTATDDQSRNRRFGIALGRGYTPEEAVTQIGKTIEGSQNAALVLKLAERFGLEMPISKMVDAILTGRLSPRQAAESLLNRPLKSELT